MDRVDQEILAGAILLSENMKLRYEEREIRSLLRTALDSIPFSTAVLTQLERLFPRFLAFIEIYIALVISKYIFLLPEEELLTGDLFPLEVLEQFDFLVNPVIEEKVREAEDEQQKERTLESLEDLASADPILDPSVETLIEELELENSALADEVKQRGQAIEDLKKLVEQAEQAQADIAIELTDLANQLAIAKEYGKEQAELVSYWSSIESGYRKARNEILSYFKSRATDTTLSSAQRWVWQNAHDYARATFFQHVNYKE